MFAVDLRTLCAQLTSRTGPYVRSCISSSALSVSFQVSKPAAASRLTYQSTKVRRYVLRNSRQKFSTVSAKAAAQTPPAGVTGSVYDLSDGFLGNLFHSDEYLIEYETPATKSRITRLRHLCWGVSNDIFDGFTFHLDPTSDAAAANAVNPDGTFVVQRADGATRSVRFPPSHADMAWFLDTFSFTGAGLPCKVLPRFETAVAEVADTFPFKRDRLAELIFVGRYLTLQPAFNAKELKDTVQCILLFIKGWKSSPQTAQPVSSVAGSLSDGPLENLELPRDYSRQPCLYFETLHGIPRQTLGNSSISRYEEQASPTAFPSHTISYSASSTDNLQLDSAQHEQRATEKERPAVEGTQDSCETAQSPNGSGDFADKAEHSVEPGHGDKSSGAAVNPYAGYDLSNSLAPEAFLEGDVMIGDQAALTRTTHLSPDKAQASRYQKGNGQGERRASIRPGPNSSGTGRQEWSTPSRHEPYAARNTSRITERWTPASKVNLSPDQRAPLPPAVSFRDGDDDTQQFRNSTTTWSDESATAGRPNRGDGVRGEELAAFGAEDANDSIDGWLTGKGLTPFDRTSDISNSELLPSARRSSGNGYAGGSATDRDREREVSGNRGLPSRQSTNGPGRGRGQDWAPGPGRGRGQDRAPGQGRGRGQEWAPSQGRGRSQGQPPSRAGTSQHNPRRNNSTWQTRGPDNEAGGNQWGAQQARVSEDTWDTWKD